MQRMEDRVSKGTPSNDRQEVGTKIERYVTELLMLKPGVMDKERPLDEWGLDSLMAVQLINEIGAQFGIALSASDISKLSVHELAEKVMVKMEEVSHS